MKKPWQNRTITWGKRILIALVLLCAAMYGVLKMAERSKEPLRLGLQDYISGVAGHPAQITDLVSATLIPDTAFKAKGIFIRDLKDDKKTLLKAEQGYVAVPFLSMIFGRPNYRGLEFKNVEVASNFWFPKKINFDFAGVSDPTPETAAPVFLMEGKYGELPFLVTSELSRKLNKKGILYQIQQNFPITFKLGQNEGQMDYKRSFSKTGFEKGVLTRGENTLEFKLEIIAKKNILARMNGALDGVFFNAELTKSEQDRVLKFISESNNTSDLENLKKFVTDIQNDLGFTDKNIKIIFERETQREEKQE